MLTTICFSKRLPKIRHLVQPPGNGVSHPVHMERLGPRQNAPRLRQPHACSRSDGHARHRCGRNGSRPRHGRTALFSSKCQKSEELNLTGKLPDWVSAKDIILEMLRRHTVSRGSGMDFRILWPGPKTSLSNGSACDRQYGRRTWRHTALYFLRTVQ